MGIDREAVPSRADDGLPVLAERELVLRVDGEFLAGDAVVAIKVREGDWCDLGIEQRESTWQAFRPFTRQHLEVVVALPAVFAAQQDCVAHRTRIDVGDEVGAVEVAAPMVVVGVALHLELTVFVDGATGIGVGIFPVGIGRAEGTGQRQVVVERVGQAGIERADPAHRHVLVRCAEERATRHVHRAAVARRDATIDDATVAEIAHAEVEPGAIANLEAGLRVHGVAVQEIMVAEPARVLAHREDTECTGVADRTADVGSAAQVLPGAHFQ